MVDSQRFGLSPNRVTVSTVGVVPRMLRFAADAPRVNLALSLHAPNQALREQIVPSARGFPLGKLMAALDAFTAQTGKGVLVECVNYTTSH